jgi:ATP-dependent RNA helicase DDX21
LAPTRELSRQVHEELAALAKPLKLSSAVFHGGVAFGPQERDCNDGLDFLVATPGRAIDHIERGILDLSGVKHVVLDEADEMLDMGFQKDIEHILSHIDMKSAQTLLFSATTPSWINSIASRFLPPLLFFFLFFLNIPPCVCVDCRSISSDTWSIHSTWMPSRRVKLARPPPFATRR